MSGRLARYRPQAAVVFGSGLAALPEGVVVDDELSYGELGWPCSAVAGHRNCLQLARLPRVRGRELKLALACGRPHLYEGWTREELEGPVRSLAAAGATRLVLTNSTGALRPEVLPADVVVAAAVIDLQRPPRRARPPRLAVCAPAQARAVAVAVAEALRAPPGGGEAGVVPVAGTSATSRGGAPRSPMPRPGTARWGTYVAVAGPQFETPAEAAWLSEHGDVVGMSAAPEVRAARAAGAECCLLALVVNRAAEVSSHADVLAYGGSLAARLAAGLGAALAARWPGLV